MALEQGASLPDIALITPDGGTIRPGDLAGRLAVLFFYPKDMTPGCTTEATEFSAALPEFTAAGVAVLGISKDPPERHATFIARHDLAVPLASDAAEDGLSDALGIWTQKVNYGRTYMGMVRTTVLLDAQGRIARTWLRVRVKGHVAAVLDAARSLAGAESEGAV